MSGFTNDCAIFDAEVPSEIVEAVIESSRRIIKARQYAQKHNKILLEEWMLVCKDGEYDEESAKKLDLFFRKDTQSDISLPENFDVKGCIYNEPILIRATALKKLDSTKDSDLIAIAGNSEYYLSRELHSYKDKILIEY